LKERKLDQTSLHLEAGEMYYIEHKGIICAEIFRPESCNAASLVSDCSGSSSHLQAQICSLYVVGQNGCQPAK